MKRACWLLAAAIAIAPRPASPDLPPAGASALRHSLARVQSSGAVLVIAAHPDDENNALLAWLARGRKFRTGYLSLTRGEGGQNLIGREQGRALGLIRTQELLAARRIDGAEQFFTRAIDFGYSKTAEETLRKWDRDAVLGDIVHIVRQFRPDAIVLEFSGTPQDGHGHHQASAILGKEAFHAAADPKRYPDQLKALGVWQAKELLCDRCSEGPGWLVPVGDFNPVLGFSYSEIGGRSRSQHQSQGMGASERRTAQPVTLTRIAGAETAWPTANDNAADPLRELLDIRNRLTDPHKRREADEAIAGALGIWVDASAPVPFAAAGAKVSVQLTAVNRSASRMRLDRVDFGNTTVWNAAEDLNQGRVAGHTYSWAAGTGPVQATFHLRVNGTPIQLTRPLVNRYVDRRLGERTRPFELVPAVSIDLPTDALVLPSAEPRGIRVQVRALTGNAKGELRWAVPAGWKVEPAAASFNVLNGQAAAMDFRVFAAGPSDGVARLTAHVDGKDYTSSVNFIRYDHIPIIKDESPAELRLVRTDVQLLSRRIGYLMGPGDNVPEALRQLGCDVTLLADLASADLTGFDAIVTGVRAFNTRPDLRTGMSQLLRYVSAGGTLVVQHNTLDSDRVSPGPGMLQIGRDRVSVEDAPVKALNPSHVLLTFPNRITDADWSGWVQERGLYFASVWDEGYQTVVASNDPGEKPLPGGLLYRPHGKGVFIFTSYSWFRQLPAGVPGAFRIFANLLSAGKSPK
ncbi:MAG TPA: PIG-L family deacetylase [Bryobacteraceae bacterium]|nr:PIG-L family deacetylase [Bryobacteraceae bacterium]